MAGGQAASNLGPVVEFPPAFTRETRVRFPEIAHSFYFLTCYLSYCFSLSSSFLKKRSRASLWVMVYIFLFHFSGISLINCSSFIKKQTSCIFWEILCIFFGFLFDFLSSFRAKPVGTSTSLREDVEAAIIAPSDSRE